MNLRPRPRKINRQMENLTESKYKQRVIGGENEFPRFFGSLIERKRTPRN